MYAVLESMTRVPFLSVYAFITIDLNTTQSCALSASLRLFSHFGLLVCFTLAPRLRFGRPIFGRPDGYALPLKQAEVFGQSFQLGGATRCAKSRRALGAWHQKDRVEFSGPCHT